MAQPRIKKTDNAPELLIDGASGIYIPQRFYKEFKFRLFGLNKKHYRALRDPDNELYWDAWIELTDKAKAIDTEGREWYLWQDGDLWLVNDLHFCPACGEPNFDMSISPDEPCVCGHDTLARLEYTDTFNQGKTKRELMQAVLGEDLTGIDSAIPQDWLYRAAELSQYSYDEILLTCCAVYGRQYKDQIVCLCWEINIDLRNCGMLPYYL